MCVGIPTDIHPGFRCFHADSTPRVSQPSTQTELGLSHGEEIERLEMLLTETKETSRRQDYLDPGRMEFSIPLEKGYLRLDHITCLAQEKYAVIQRNNQRQTET